MPSLQGAQPGRKIGSAVGKQPARNSLADQNVILDLLAGVSTDDGGPPDPLPQAVQGGSADFRLIDAILRFQIAMAARGLMPKRNTDGRVDPNGTTLRLLNQFSGGGGGGGGGGGDNGGGGGTVIPTDPRLPPTPPQKSAGFLQALFAKLTPRATNLRLAGAATSSGSVLTFGALGGRLSIVDANRGPTAQFLDLLGVGLSLGPAPFGVEIAPSQFPSLGSAINAGPRTTGTTLTLDDLTGVCVVVGASAGAAAGGNASAFMFNVGSNRSLDTIAEDLLVLTGTNAANSFVIDAFNTCRAFSSTVGIFMGASVGVSLIEAVVRRVNPDIRPDPDARPLPGGGFRAVDGIDVFRQPRR